MEAQLGQSIENVPVLMLRKIPACPSCNAANPAALDFCPACGAQAPMPTDLQVVEAVSPKLFPWHARLLLRIGAWLKRFAASI